MENKDIQINNTKIKRVHLVGIGGAGMGGIAEVLLNQGCSVTGSDVSANSMVERLRSLGAHIVLKHQEENVIGADVVVRSSAISENNPEILEAKQRLIPVVARAEMLAELMRFHHGIAIAGTHGKTTTTSLVTSILMEAKKDPTYVIGGLLKSSGTNAHRGSGQYFVVEADESDASFLFLKPMMAIVTNIDADHMSTYHGDFNYLKQTFIQFLHHLPLTGLAVLCREDPVVVSILPEVSRPLVTYGFSREADITAENIRQTGTTCYFDVYRKGIKNPLPITLNLAGRHNVLNALAAIGIATALHIEDEAIVKALSEFQGIGRRFQILGEYDTENKKVLLVDDYGHHPKEVAATLAAARAAWPDRRIVMAYQPHRYTRTRDLFDDFAEVLSEVDELLLLNVYPAGEEPISGADSHSLSRAIRQRGKIEPIFVGDLKKLPEALHYSLKDGDVLFAQGAGDIGAFAKQLAQCEMRFSEMVEGEH